MKIQAHFYEKCILHVVTLLSKPLLFVITIPLSYLLHQIRISSINFSNFIYGQLMRAYIEVQQMHKTCKQ